MNQDLETVIDSVIQLSKGNFQINQKQQKLIIKCLLQLCQCISKKDEVRKTLNLFIINIKIMLEDIKLKIYEYKYQISGIIFFNSFRYL